MHCFEIGEEEKITVNSYFLFFTHSSINTEDFSQYFCYFIQHSNDILLVLGFGIGRPSQPNQSVLIDFIDVKIYEQQVLSTSVIVDYSEDQKIFHFILEEPIIFPPNTEIFIHVEINGKGNYIFNSDFANMVSTKGVDGNTYMDSFPILYFLV